MKAFTIPEVILVLGLVAVLSAFAVINLVRPQGSVSVDSAVNLLVADIKQQQLKAMIGDTQGQVSAQTFGVHFEQTRYVLFRGASYSVGGLDNFVIDLGSNINLTSISTPDIVFARESGEIGVSFSVVVTSLVNSSQKTITINKFGMVSVN